MKRSGPPGRAARTKWIQRMDSTADTAARQEISLLDSLRGEWLKLPLAVMQDVGPATQTLGGLLKVTIRETFTSVEKIAGHARLSVKTVRKHLVSLHDRGWIENLGRCKTRAGHTRRTATIRIMPTTREHLKPYGILPWWACCYGPIRFPWAVKAVLAVWLSRLCGTVKGIQERTGDGDGDGSGEEVEMMIAEYGEPRFRLSLRDLIGQTGLSHHSVIQAKRKLHKAGIIKLMGGEEGAREPDTLLPSWDFRVVVTPTGSGKCHVHFLRGSKSG